MPNNVLTTAVNLTTDHILLPIVEVSTAKSTILHVTKYTETATIITGLITVNAAIAAAESQTDNDKRPAIIIYPTGIKILFFFLENIPYTV